MATVITPTGEVRENVHGDELDYYGGLVNVGEEYTITDAAGASVAVAVEHPVDVEPVGSHAAVEVERPAAAGALSTPLPSTDQPVA